MKVSARASYATWRLSLIPSLARRLKSPTVNRCESFAVETTFKAIGSVTTLPAAPGFG